MNKKGFFLLLSLILSMAFQKVDIPAEEQAIIDQAVEEKVNNYRQKRRKECRTKLLERANEIVDSTLIANAKALSIDTIARPPKPIKPVKPKAVELKVATPISPILSSEEKQ